MRIICWIKGHVWRPLEPAEAYPAKEGRSCLRCGLTEWNWYGQFWARRHIRTGGPHG